jgi:RHS repeat-associated protein
MATIGANSYPYSYAPGSNRLTGVARPQAITYSYDAADGRKTFTYDARGRLVEVRSGHLVGEYNPNGVLLRETVWLDDTPVAVLKGTSVYYVQADRLNAPRVITDSQNRIVWRWDNAGPFGVGAPNENPSGLGAFSYNLRLPGQYYDQETGLHYNTFRDYEPGTGRYVQGTP